MKGTDGRLLRAKTPSHPDFWGPKFGGQIEQLDTIVRQGVLVLSFERYAFNGGQLRVAVPFPLKDQDGNITHLASLSMPLDWGTVVWRKRRQTVVLEVLVQILAASEVASENGRGVIMRQPRPSRLPELSSAARAAFRP